MLGIIALIVLAIVAICIFSAALHFLFSPLVLIAIGVLLFIKFRPRRSIR
jgi:hypothetical protein